MTAVGVRARVLATITEREWQDQVIAWAKRAEWLVHHVHDSRKDEWGCHPGFPDLVLVRAPRVLFVELKRDRGYVSTLQAVWLASLRASPGVETYTWRPRDEIAVRECLA